MFLKCVIFFLYNLAAHFTCNASTLLPVYTLLQCLFAAIVLSLCCAHAFFSIMHISFQPIVLAKCTSAFYNLFPTCSLFLFSRHEVNSNHVGSCEGRTRNLAAQNVGGKFSSREAITFSVPRPHTHQQILSRCTLPHATIRC